VWELVLVLAPGLDRLVAMALLVRVMLLGAVPAVGPEAVKATMVGSAAVEAPDQDPVPVDTLKFHFRNKLEPEPNTQL